MAFKMKGPSMYNSPLQQSPIKHTGVGKHYHGPNWLPDRELKSGSASGENPYQKRKAFQRSLQLRGIELGSDEYGRETRKWTARWKERHNYESMPSSNQMKEIPYDPNNPDAGSVMDNIQRVPVSAEDDNPRVLMGSDYKGEDVSGVITTDQHAEPTASSEELVTFGTNKELLEKTRE